MSRQVARCARAGAAAAAAVEALERRALLSFTGAAGAGGGDLHADHDHEQFAEGTVPYCPPPPVVDDELVQAADVVMAAAAPPYPLGQTFLLHSRPAATKTIYLDFDGHLTSDTSWNSTYHDGADFYTPAYSLDTDLTTFSSTELERIQRIWQRVVEDFIPFNVNVTTQEPPIEDLRNTGGGDTRWGVRVVIGGDGDWYGNAGGVAFVGSFRNSTDTPCFVFEDNLGGGAEKSVAEAASHEVGHTLGLSHDGRTSPSEVYYSGHGFGATGWAPIMGSGYSRQLTQWSKGEYASANNTQDDLAIITGANNGVGYVADDHGNTAVTATTLSFNAAGIIERSTDVDVFALTLSATTTVNVAIDPFYLAPNLDILAELYDAANALIAASNPVDALSASIHQTLAPGAYFLHVSGTGKGDPLATGYSDYGSIGYYSISGIPPANDSFASRALLSGQSAATTGSNIGATKEAGEPDHAANAGGQSVWWTWTAPTSERYFITTADSSFDTLLGVYTGSAVGALTAIASNDNGGIIGGGGGGAGVLTSRVLLDAIAGTVYQVAVDGFNGASGSIALSLGLAPPPPGVPSNPTPPEGALLNTRSLTLDWDDAPHASSYDVYLGDEATPSATVTASEFGLVKPPDGVQRWRVVAKNPDYATSGPQWQYTVDTTAPDVILNPPAPAVAGKPTLDFTLIYSDLTSGVDVATLDSNDVVVFGPDGYTQLAQFIGVDLDTNGSPRAATYRITAPGGMWNRADDGVYTVVQQAEQVRDLAGNARDLDVAGSFSVSLPFAWLRGSTLHVEHGPTGLPIALDLSGAEIAVTENDMTVLASSASEIVVTGTDGNDTLQHDATMPAPITLALGAGEDLLQVRGGTYAFAADAAASSANLAIEVAAGAAVIFAATQHLRALTVDGSAVVDGDDLVLVTGAISVGPIGRLDLKHNDLILDLPAGAPAPDVQAWVVSARNGGQWDGFGIATSEPAARQGLTTLGVAPLGALVAATGADTAVFAGETVSAAAVLVKYTYAGDANGDGVVSGDDYTAIDYAIAIPGAGGWINGDFNFDGLVSGDDYTIIDYMIAAQGAPL